MNPVLSVPSRFHSVSWALPISVELDRMFVGCIQDTSHLEEWLDLYRLGREAQRRAGSYR